MDDGLCFSPCGHFPAGRQNASSRSRGTSLPGGSMAAEDLYRWNMFEESKRFLQILMAVSPTKCSNSWFYFVKRHHYFIRLRNFSTRGKKVINKGDSFKWEVTIWRMMMTSNPGQRVGRASAAPTYQVSTPPPFQTQGQTLAMAQETKSKCSLFLLGKGA